MKNKHVKWLTGLLALLMIFTLTAPVVWADDTNSFAIPVRINTTGPVPAGVEYRIILTADDPAYPLPAGAEDGVYVYTTRNAGDHVLAPIEFTEVGIYTYTIEQKSNHPRCTFDKEVYELTIYVTYNEEGGLEIRMVAYKEGSTEKVDLVEFNNRCTKPGVTEPPVTEPDETEPPVTEPDETEPPVTEPDETEPPVTEPPETEETEKPDTEPVKKTQISVQKVWKDDGKDRPDFVNVQLMDGNRVVDTVKLSAKNHWGHTWTGLDGKGNWDVREVNVPKGYKATYSQEGTVITITNSKVLLDTGQLKWPIPILATLGTGLILAGAGLLKKRNENEA